MDNQKDRNKILSSLSKIKLDSYKIVDLIKSSPDYVLISNKNNQFVWVSDSFIRDFGWTNDDLESMRFLDFIHKDDIEAVKKQHEQDIQGNRSVIDSPLFAFRMRTKEGNYKYVELNLKDQHPIHEHLIAIARPYLTDVERSFKADSKPAYIETTFLGNPDIQSMTWGESWGEIFEGMELRDVAISSTDSIAWQCYLKDGERFKDRIIMDWHCHNKQIETLFVINGNLKVLIEVKKWWHRFMFWRKNGKIKHYKTVVLKAYEHIKIPKGTNHILIGTGDNSNYMVFWSPKLFK